MTTTTHRTRRDAYPLEGGEHLAPCGHIAPCGCDQAACCFDCPHPKCRFDAGGMNRIRARSRAKALKALKRRGYTSHEMAATLGVSRRTVFRHLAGG